MVQLSKSTKIGFAFLFLTVGIVPALADSVTTGSSAGENSFPFTNSSYVGEYQQVYESSLFSGPIEITGITFFNGAADSPNATITGTFTLSFSTTAVGITSLSTNYASNIGVNNARFFSGSVSNTLTFTGTPFLYNPSQGNLLLDVNVSSGTGSGEYLAAGCSADTNRVFNSGGNGAVSTNLCGTGGEGVGLETEFTFTPVANAAAPEPATFSALAMGALALLAGAKVKLRG